MSVDRAYGDRDLAGLYDALNPWGPGDEFYLDLVLAFRSVLDVGCGTGALLHRARAAGHTGRLVGLDPAAAMLAHARRRADVEWLLGDLARLDAAGEFDLVVMTGHAFQVLVTDGEVRAGLAAVRAALTRDGRFAFETRNPVARPWQRWTPAHAVEVADAHGRRVRVAHRVHGPVDGRVVRFSTTFDGPGWNGPRISESTLRFLDRDELAAFLSDAGLVVDQQFGNWDRSAPTDACPEIITIVRPV